MTTKEEFAVVLDFLPNGYPLNDGTNAKKGAVVQAIGLQNFVLLELVPKTDVHLKSGDQVYVGGGKRDHIHHINGRIPLNKLTNTASGELKAMLPVLIDLNQDKFVEFFKKYSPIIGKRKSGYLTSKPNEVAITTIFHLFWCNSIISWHQGCNSAGRVACIFESAWH